MEYGNFVQLKSKRIFLSFCALIVACLFYSTGNFGFLNIFGVRRLFQFVFLTIFSFSLITISPKKILNSIKEPVALLSVFTLLVSVVRFSKFIDVIDKAVAVFLICMIFSVGKSQYNRILMFIIYLSAIFASAALIQGILIWFRPEFIYHLGRPYLAESGAEKVTINHPIQYLGFADISSGYKILGHDLVRLCSFASEPAHLVYSFLIPALLGLTYSGKIRIASLIVMLFLLIFSGSGSVLLSLALGIVSLGFFYLLKSRPRFVGLLPFILALILFVNAVTMDIPYFATKVTQPFVGYQNVFSSLASKYHSLSCRLSTIADNVKLFIRFPLGVPFERPGGIGGGLLNVYIWKAGIFGLVFGIFPFYQIFKYCATIVNTNRKYLLPIALLYGSLIQVIAFNGVGWYSTPGFMIVALVIRRLRTLLELTI